MLEDDDDNEAALVEVEFELSRLISLPVLDELCTLCDDDVAECDEELEIDIICKLFSTGWNFGNLSQFLAAHY